MPQIAVALDQIGYTLVAILGFGFIIFIHELGHFLAAKAFKVKATAFSLGFPPTILHKQFGETDYRIGAIPIGGYVSMIGEDPTEKTEDPRALPNVKPWKRAIIFLAGVTMNLISAMIIYMVASVIGIEVTAPVVGDAVVGTPAYGAGLRAGDRIKTIDGKPINAFDDIRMIVVLGALDNPDHQFAVQVERPGEAQPLTFTVKAEPKDVMGLPSLGLALPIKPIINEVTKDSPVDKMGLRQGDVIEKVNDLPIPFVSQFGTFFHIWPTAPFTITVQRAGQEVVLKVDPATITNPDYGFSPPVLVKEVVQDSPAEKAGMKTGDFIIQAGDYKYPTFPEIEKVTRASEGRPVRFVVRRDTQQLNLDIAPNLDPMRKIYMIGFATGGAADEAPVLKRLGEPGAASAAGIPDGARITAINGNSFRTWTGLNERVSKLDGKPAKLTYQLPDGTEKTVEVVPQQIKPQEIWGVTFIQDQREKLAPIYNPLLALNLGLTKIREVIDLQRVSIKALANKRVDTKELSGPIRIGFGFYKMAEAGVSKYFMFLGLVSIAIALLNVMPLPPLDGGLVLFLVIEKLRGGPVPLRAQRAIMMVGWVLLLSLMAFAFFNDIRWAIGQLFT
jgi:regulator of sigma E protease